MWWSSCCPHLLGGILASQSCFDLACVVVISQAMKLTYNHGGTTGCWGLQMGNIVQFEVWPSRHRYLSADVGIQVLFFGTVAIKNGMTYGPYLALVPDVATYCHIHMVQSVRSTLGVAAVMT